MWCSVCQSDVATELSADDRRLNCTRCGCELATTIVPVRGNKSEPHHVTVEAAELLARWSAENLIQSENALPEVLQRRTSSANDVFAVFEVDQTEADPEPVSNDTPAIQKSRGRRTRRTSLTVVCGQLAAYLGVLLLTCGATIVIASHYRQAPRSEMTGWLLATVGQMFMFLGVITLVTHSLEQLRADVQKQLRKLHTADSVRARKAAEISAASKESMTAASRAA